MIKTKNTWTVTNIQKMYREKKVLSFDHPIQRQSGQWDLAQKGLLIHSMLAGYPIPNIYVLKEDSEQLDEKGKPVFQYYVIDGKQRLTNVLSYLNGDYALDDSIPAIRIEDETYAIASKYFQDLEEPVQYELKRFKFDIFNFEECTSDEVEEIFFRLNNSTTLTKAQVAKAKIGTDLAIMVNELLTSRFFMESCNFSNAQRKNSDDQRSLFQGMMLLDNFNGRNFTLKDFSENSIMEYSNLIKGNYSDEQVNYLRSCIEFLSDAFPVKQKSIRKIHIPMLVLAAYFAMDKEIKPLYFRQWWEYFNDEDGFMEVYKTFCSSGSTKLEKIKGRVVIMMKSFTEYNESGMPEELADWNHEVEEILRAREAEQAEVLKETTVLEEGQEEMEEEAGQQESVEENEIPEAEKVFETVEEQPEVSDVEAESGNEEMDAEETRE